MRQFHHIVIFLCRFHNGGVCVQHVHFEAGGTAASKPFSTCVPLFSLGEFLEFTCPLHVCRAMMVNAISSLNEGSISDQQDATAVILYKYSVYDIEFFAHQAIGPTLEALVAWMLHVTSEDEDGVANASMELPFSQLLDYFSGIQLKFCVLSNLFRIWLLFF